MQIGHRIIVADDHGIVRMGLIQIIKHLRPSAIISEAEDFKSLYTFLSQSDFDLAIVDVNMPNGSMQEAIDYIKIHQPKLKILVFSSQDEDLYAMRYLKMGADGYLNKLSASDRINQALNAMLDKGRYISEEVTHNMMTNSIKGNQTISPLESLSNRELQVANKLVEGLPLKELSQQLNLHTSTISTYKNRVFEKLDIQSIPELVEILRIYQ